MASVLITRQTMYIDFFQNNDTAKYFFELTSFDLGQKSTKFDLQIQFSVSFMFIYYIVMVKSTVEI